jgi:hypothetical protein
MEIEKARDQVDMVQWTIGIDRKGAGGMKNRELLILFDCI